MKTDGRSTATRCAILGLIAEKPRTGYEIRKAFESDVGHFWAASYGQIYPELSAIADGGLAKVSERKTRGRPARKIYAITSEGRAYLRRWLSEPPRARPVRNELALKLCFGANGRPGDLVAFVGAFQAEHERRRDALKEIEQSMADAPRTPELVCALATLRMGIAVSTAMAAWATQTALDLGALDSRTRKKGARHAA